MPSKYFCPSCKQKTGVDIVYSKPTPDLLKRVDKGDIVLIDGATTANLYSCMACGANWDSAQHFEEVKRKWLEKEVKGRSWTALMDDHDKEVDEAAAKIHTPEYLAMWEKTSAEFDALEDELDRESKQSKNPKK